MVEALQILAGGQIVLEGLEQGGAADASALRSATGSLPVGDLPQQLHGFVAGLFDGQVAVAAERDAFDLAVNALFRDERFGAAAGDPQAEPGDGAIAVKRLGGFAVGVGVGRSTLSTNDLVIRMVESPCTDTWNP